MSYKSIIYNNSKDVHNAAIATKILQHISRVRDNRSEDQARRFVWELIQNAKDAKFDGSTVKIKIELFADKLKFSHTGKPFSVKNILCIINQVSSKVPEDTETTGEFGTGFVATHLLSEKVILRGICEDVYDNTQLAAKKFQVILDRSGNTQEEVIEAVDCAIEVVRNLDDEPDVNYNPDGYNTTFTYIFEEEHCFRTAQQGIDDLKYSVMYALAFVNGISEIEIINHVQNHSKIYSASNKVPFNNSDIIKVFAIHETSSTQTLNHRILIASNNDIDIAIAIDDENRFIGINKFTPRLFCDFPLIGSENFPYPIVINSRGFKPNETRTFVPLSVNAAAINSNINKKIFLNSIELYHEILKMHSCLDRYYHCAVFKELPSRPDFDVEWYQEHVLLPIFEYLQKYPIVNTINSKDFIQNMLFPKSNTLEDTASIKNLNEIFQYLNLPVPNEAYGWNYALYNLPKGEWFKVTHITLKDTVELKERLLKVPIVDSISHIEFVNKIYLAVLEDERLSKEFYSGEVTILPDQNQPPKLRCINDIFIDPNIDEHIKKAADLLDSIPFEEGDKLDIRSKLLNKEFKMHKNDNVKVFSVNDLASQVNNITLQSLPDGYKDTKVLACIYLLACYEDQEYFNSLQKIYKRTDIEYTPTICRMSKLLWSNAIDYIFDCMKDIVEESGNIDTLYENYFVDTPDNVIIFLGRFFKCFESHLIVERRHIFPNQLGEFKHRSDLMREQGLDEHLKEICMLLASDPNISIRNCYEFLLHKELELEFLQKYSAKDIAFDITQSINLALNSEGGLTKSSDNVANAATLLLSWIEDNETAETLFSQFYSDENRMKLLTTKAASNMSKKLKRFDDILRRGNLSLDELQVVVEMRQSDKVYSDDKCEIDFSLLDSRLDKDVFAKKVGAAGELYAFDIIAEDENSENVVARNNNYARYEYDDTIVEIIINDIDSYKQSEFDIIKKVINKNTLEVIDTHYYEVKSTVRGRMVNYIDLTPTEFAHSVKHRENYTVMRMYLAADLSLIKHVKINDILGSMGNNEIYPQSSLSVYMNN